MNGHPPDLFGIVLAGGRGERMLPLTRALCGDDTPKQFVSLAGNRTLLQASLDRIAPLVPPDRTFVVVGAEHEEIAREQLANRPGVRLEVEPRPLGTLPAILLPLARLAGEAPDARVAVFPSDHHIENVPAFMRAFHAAESVAAHFPRWLALVAVPAERHDTELGWIVPGPALDAAVPAVAVERFVERPSDSAVRHLIRQHALWSTMITVGSASSFWEAAAAHSPLHAALFLDYSHRAGGRGAERELRRLYARLEPADFSRSVLQRHPLLAAVRAEGAGWHDLGRPDRVFRSLAGTPELASLMGRLSGKARLPRTHVS